MTEESIGTEIAKISTGKVAGGLVPKNFDEMYRLANLMSKTGIAPKGFDRPEQVMMAIQMGMEVGLSPMQAVQNIAVINGKPSVYGDAAIGLARASGLMAEHSEKPITDKAGNVVGYEVHSKRTDGSEITHRFTLDDAKRAGLLGKSGPWKDYPQRMLQMRARSWVIRDLYADVLKGLRVYEEVMDYVDADGVVVEKAETPTESLKARLAAVVEKPTEIDAEPQPDPEILDAEIVEPDPAPEPKKGSLRDEVESAAIKLTAATDGFAVGNLLLKHDLPPINDCNGGQLKKALNAILCALAELE